MLIGGALIAAAVALWLNRPKEGDCWFFDAACMAKKAGKDAAQTVYNVYAGNVERSGGLFTGLTVDSAIARNIAQGSPADFEAVPVTPTGFTSSNWTWSKKDTAGSVCKIGLPAGMTLAEFCNTSPTAPICHGVC
jgi:hypothetical protein